MKRWKVNLQLVTFILIAVFLSACSGKTEDKLKGTWWCYENNEMISFGDNYSVTYIYEDTDILQGKYSITENNITFDLNDGDPLGSTDRFQLRNFSIAGDSRLGGSIDGRYLVFIKQSLVNNKKIVGTWALNEDGWIDEDDSITFNANGTYSSGKNKESYELYEDVIVLYDRFDCANCAEYKIENDELTIKFPDETYHFVKIS